MILNAPKLCTMSFTEYCSYLWSKTQQVLNKTYKTTCQSLMEEVKKILHLFEINGEF